MCWAHFMFLWDLFGNTWSSYSWSCCSRLQVRSCVYNEVLLQYWTLQNTDGWNKAKYLIISSPHTGAVRHWWSMPGPNPEWTTLEMAAVPTAKSAGRQNYRSDSPEAWLIMDCSVWRSGGGAVTAPGGVWVKTACGSQCRSLTRWFWSRVGLADPRGLFQTKRPFDSVCTFDTEGTRLLYPNGSDRSSSNTYPAPRPRTAPEALGTLLPPLTHLTSSRPPHKMAAAARPRPPPAGGASPAPPRARPRGAAPLGSAPRPPRRPRPPQRRSLPCARPLPAAARRGVGRRPLHPLPPPPPPPRASQVGAGRARGPSRPLLRAVGGGGRARWSRGRRGRGAELSSPPPSAPSPPLRAMARSPRPGVRCPGPAGSCAIAPCPLSPPGRVPGPGPGRVRAPRAGQGTREATPGAVSPAEAETEGAVPPLCPLSWPLAAPGGAGPSCSPACGRELFLAFSTRSSVRGAGVCVQGCLLGAYSPWRGASGCVRAAHGSVSWHT